MKPFKAPQNWFLSSEWWPKFDDIICFTLK
jgi:hypothetical protein